MKKETFWGFVFPLGVIAALVALMVFTSKAEENPLLQDNIHLSQFITTCYSSGGTAKYLNGWNCNFHKK